VSAFEVAKMTLLTGLLSLTAIAAQGQTFQNIGDFTSGNGAWFPNAPLTQGPNGILYGTTQRGGTHGDGNSGGTVFQLALNSSTVTTLYNFCSQVSSVGVCTDGEFINGGLIQDSDGNFYGTTYFGGANTNTGSVFKLTSGGVLTTLYDFCSVNSCADGASPQMGLLLGTDGNFYGTTSSGGAYQSGTVFKITPAGALTTLYSFCGRGLCPNGGGEAVTLVEGSDGEFYGTTSMGRSARRDPGRRNGLQDQLLRYVQHALQFLRFDQLRRRQHPGGSFGCGVGWQLLRHDRDGRNGLRL